MRKPQNEDVVQNLYDLVCGKYKFASANRDNEYAEYEDFESRFLKNLNEGDRVEVFREVYFLLEELSCLRVLLWLSVSNQVRLDKIYFDLIRQDCNENRRIEFTKFVVDKIETWSSHAKNNISVDDRALLNDVCGKYRIDKPI